MLLSHAVGLEHVESFGTWRWDESRHPTQWARNETTTAKILREFGNMSPSHTVGLELLSSSEVAALYNGHHPTRWAWNLKADKLDDKAVQKISHHPTRWA